MPGCNCSNCLLPLWCCFGCRNEQRNRNETGHIPLPERTGRNHTDVLRCAQGQRNLKHPTTKATCDPHSVSQPDFVWWWLNSTDLSVGICSSINFLAQKFRDDRTCDVRWVRASGCVKHRISVPTEQNTVPAPHSSVRLETKSQRSTVGLRKGCNGFSPKCSFP